MHKRPDGLYQKQITIAKKPKYFYGRTIAEVNRKILEYKGEVENGRTFKTVSEEWLESTKLLSFNTQRIYKWIIGLIEFDSFIKDISPQDIKKHLEKMAKKQYSKKTVSQFKSVLNMIFDYAVVEGDLQINPMASVSMPKNLPSKEREMPSEEEIEIIKNSTHLEFGLFAYFLLYTGCRRSEALALTWNDIDFDKKLITINKIVEYHYGSPVIKNKTKTEAGTREVILLDKLSEKLKKGKGFIFGSDDRGKLQYRWDKYCKQAGLWKDGKHTVTPHQLRHAYATMLFEADIDPMDAMDLLGHSDITTTRNIYTQIRKTRKEHTAETLNKFIFT